MAELWLQAWHDLWVIWFWAVVLVVIIGAVVVVAMGRTGTMAEVYDDRPDSTLPTGRPLTSEDIRAIRFSTGLRGYRMDEVDALLERFEADLLAREGREVEPADDAEHPAPRHSNQTARQDPPAEPDTEDRSSA